ncbi:hypothetical protein LZ31DRAFT_55568 [Colletotrichum somersetense]|nr:hypothetical protein LZ31DRAFT_55568 [Colletotrichum somersetense]
MEPAAPLPIAPLPAHCRSFDADEVGDLEAAVAAARAGKTKGQGLKAAIFQAKDLEAITQLALMMLKALAQRLPPQPSLKDRLPFAGQALPLAHIATRGLPAALVRRAGYRSPAVSEERQTDTFGGHGSNLDEGITTPSEANPAWGPAVESILGANAPSATDKNPFLQSRLRDRNPFKAFSSRPSTNRAKERRERVEAALEPLCDAAPFVLMCAGDPGRAVVVPVAVGENADAVDQWTAIQNVSRKYASRWRSWVSPPRLELVIIRIVGPHELRAEAFRGTFEPVDVAARLSLLREQARGSQLYTTEPWERDRLFETRCYHDTSSGRVIHWGLCCDPDVYKPADLYCDVQDQRERLEEISKLELIPSWSMFLADPSLAWANDPLLEDWIYDSKTIIPPQHRKVIHSVGQIEFTGLRLSEWPYGRQNGVPGPLFVGGTMTFCGIIFAARVIHGDWGIAYTAGAFFVALAGVLSTWVVGQPINPSR